MISIVEFLATTPGSPTNPRREEGMISIVEFLATTPGSPIPKMPFKCADWHVILR